ncbi:MAG: VTT domain-containing protein [Desulfarculaceae bacterium]|nr:VTT domain-containing protein [Desulfarculaceae bacterium]MCF8046490.1 VTT domain-containing protein [Desulfarculaceae bacterium]MCF8065355.1 VTT domain-containing protein [Desulfarculaceae bacterium]MCF8096485.1 VTT domain-containing protein [Desulfarculaceae bacterium]MCF8121025.1 VTT domain-containing protein [Desulfarculaceae bacterium]
MAHQTPQPDSEHPLLPQHVHGWRSWLKAAVIPALLLALCAFWRWGPLNGLLDEHSLDRLAATVQGMPLAPLAALGGFLVGGLVMLPVVLLIGATGMIFGPWLGAAYALAGALISALALYGLGFAAGHKTLAKFSGGKIGKVSQKMADHGVTTIIILRVLPVAPFTLINLAAGASRVRILSFAVGTLLGMIPVTLAITVFADRLRRIWQDPHWEDLAVAAGVLIALGLFTWLLKRWLKRRHHPGV